MSASRSSLQRAVDDLGSTVLEVLAGGAGLGRGITGVVIHDPLDPQPVDPDSLVLAVGLSSAADLAALAALPGVAAVVVRAPFPVTTQVRRALGRDGVLLGLTRGASWAHVTAMLRSSLGIDDVGEGGSLGGLPAGDLFAVANAVSALIDAPVTIEDRASRVLAYSAGQDSADSSRIETVLGREVPERFRTVLEERGVFRELYSGDTPVHVTEIPGADLDRLAVRVHAGDDVLGSIWAAVSGPITAERSQALADAAKLVALHMLRARAGSDVERRVRSDLVATVLDGGRGAADAASRLGLSRGSLTVLALAPLVAGEGETAGAEAVFERLASAFAMHLAAVHPTSAVAQVGRVVYGLLPHKDPDRAAARTRAVAEEFADRLGERSPVVIGIGRVAADRTGLPRSRAEADRALRVLTEGLRPERVATAEEVHVDALLLELADVVERDGAEFTGPLALIQAYDTDHRSDLVDTLRAWLDAFGDVNRAAASLHVHPNTFRYRLKRLAEVGGLDLEDPDARFAAELQLRLAAIRPT